MKIETLPHLPVLPTVRASRRRRGALALAVAVAAGAAWMALRPAPAAAPAASAVEKAPVFELARGDVSVLEARALQIRLPLSGSLMPLKQATVKSKASGVVLEASLQEGMRVNAGQLLARIDSADQQARVAQQQAALDEATARLALATKNNANSLALLQQHYISQASYDSTHNSVELAQASVKAARAQLDMARIALADTVIRAPIAGVISKRHVQAGEKLAPDMPVVSIVDLRELTLEAQVPASDIPRVKPGQDVQFHVDGFGHRGFAGKVARINPSAEAGSRAMLVYISVDNADSALRGGMFAKGSITTDMSAVMPLLPLSALRKEGGADVVYRIDGGKVVSQPVKLGMQNEDEGMAAVAEGLAPGASVLVTRLDGVKPGSSVKLALATKG